MSITVGQWTAGEVEVAALRDRLMPTRRITERGCWVSEGRKPDTRGYMKIRAHFRSWTVHRLAYLVLVGPLPYDLWVCHHCDNPPCWNPEHLYAGTATDNNRDTVRRGRHRMAADFAHRRGERNGRARLTEADVREIRSLPGLHTVVGAQFGVTGSLVSKIRRGLRWRHV
jgi:hypothetical protein